MIYTGIPLVTLQEQLALAQAALFPLSRGEAVGAISTTDNKITFVPTTVESLQQHIRDLMAAIALLSGAGTPRKGFYIFGGKGL